MGADPLVAQPREFNVSLKQHVRAELEDCVGGGGDDDDVGVALGTEGGEEIEDSLRWGDARGVCGVGDCAPRGELRDGVLVRGCADEEAAEGEGFDGGGDEEV